MIPVLIGMIVFSVLHSLLAGQTARQLFRQRLGERAYFGLYRLAYNVLAIVTLVPVLALAFLYPGEIIWRADMPWSLLLAGVQVVGAAGVIVSLLQISAGQFSGLSQLEAYISGKPLPLPAEPLQIKGLYRVVRHPLYLFSLLAIWPMVTMTEALLVFNVAATVYFVAGSLLEEKRLEAAFGQDYTDYKARVPWLIPLPRFFR